MATQQRGDAIDVFIQDKRQGSTLADGQTVFIRTAWLFNIDVPVANGVYDARRVIHSPAGIRVGNEDFAFGQYVRGGMNSIDVLARSATDLELELRIAIGTMSGNILRHF